VSIPRTPRAGEAGVTVVEMAVVIALLSIVLALVFQSVAAFQNAATGSQDRLRNLDEARVIMAVVTRDLRTATDFCPIAVTCPSAVFEPDDVTFLGHLETVATTGTTTTTLVAPTAPNKVRLYVDGQGRLWEEITVPDDPAASPLTYTGAPRTRVVGRHVVDTDDLFTFYDDGDPAQEVDDPDSSTVAEVAVSLSVSVPSGRPVPATVLESRVWLPNVAAGGTGA